MSQTIAVFGAGQGLALEVARRFGREGFAVALVARRTEKLETLASQLEDDGIEVAIFTTDLTRHQEIPALIDKIEARFGHIDVTYFGPNSPIPLQPATDLDPTTVQRLADLFLLAPIAITRMVLPGMVERDHGAILVSQGSSAIDPVPGMSGAAAVMAATRNYLLSLHRELATTGVNAATLTIGALVDNSEMAVTMSEEVRANFPVASPHKLADLLWSLATSTDRFEYTYPPTDPS